MLSFSHWLEIHRELLSSVNTSIFSLQSPSIALHGKKKKGMRRCYKDGRRWKTTEGKVNIKRKKIPIPSLDVDRP